MCQKLSNCSIVKIGENTEKSRGDLDFSEKLLTNTGVKTHNKYNDR